MSPTSVPATTPESTATPVPYAIPLASFRQSWQFRLLVAAWVLSQISFWTWWLRDDHVVTLVGMLLNSLLLVWTTFLPAWLLFFVGRAKRPNPALPLPEGRVAMVVTKAPSEPWLLVRTTLEAMLAQEFPRPYSVWLADEDPTAETRAWCAAHGVQVSCRKGVADYNNPTWPRREKCKEGNLTYFYEVMGGYENYDFVAQLDADHVPEPTYLTEMIRPFADPGVGYVAAPSVCDANARHSWAARGRLYAEAALHGVLQAGYNAGFAPLCIGSHYAIRTTALRQVGGLGPELAEDFSTTLLMNAGGWRGAFAIDAMAHGDGPASVADCLTQEFQWSRSVTNIFLSIWGIHRGKLPLKVRLQLGFGPVWYLAFTAHLVLGYLLPILALAFHTPWVSVDLPEFFLRASIPSAVALLTVTWIRRRGWLRPATAPVLSWESILFEYVRWPWMAIGIGYAIVGRLTGKQFAFRVTPKGATQWRPLPHRVMIPYVVIVVAEASATLLVDRPGAAMGYAYLALLAAVSYVVVIAAIILLQLLENRRQFPMPRAYRVRAAVRFSPVPAFSLAVVGLTMLVRGEAVFDAILPSRAAPLAEFNGPAAVVLRAAAAPSPSAPELVVDSTPDALPVEATPAPTVRPLDLAADRIGIGAYDPHLQLTETQLDLDQWYIRQDDPQLLAGALAHARDQRSVLVTVEPWPVPGSTTADVLQDVASGRADEQLRALARVTAANAPQVVLVRWGHEMELANLYPWGARDPALYQQAFRHVVEVFRAEGAVNARFVWSPAGNDNALAYYPGGDVVDYVGVTVLADATWDANFGLAPQTFDDIFGPRYQRLAPLGRPIIISELGVSGTPERQAAWLAQAARSLPAYPELRAMVYFDDRNPAVNNLATQPDWRLAGAPLETFLGLARAAAAA